MRCTRSDLEEPAWRLIEAHRMTYVFFLFLFLSPRRGKKEKEKGSNTGKTGKRGKDLPTYKQI